MRSLRRKGALPRRLSVPVSLGLIIATLPWGFAARTAWALQPGTLGSIQLQYSATISDSNTCHIAGSSSAIDVCAYNYAGGQGGTQDYTGAYSGSLHAVVPITTTDNLKTPVNGSGRLTETINGMHGSGTFTDTNYPVAGCISSGTETFNGGPTAPGNFSVANMSMSTSPSGDITDFTLSPSIPLPSVELASPGDVTIWTSTATPGPNCPLGQLPPAPGNAGLSRAGGDVAAMEFSLGLPTDIHGFPILTGWTIDPNHDWTPQQGGVLAQKILTGTTQFLAPDAGTITVTETFQIVTGSCLPPPSTAITTAALASQATPAAAGGDSVDFDPVRNLDTPKGMPDRIPPNPGHETTVTIHVHLDTCSDSKVEISSEGLPADGTVLINGQPTFTLLRRGTYTLDLSIRGVTQTEIGRGPHLTLVANEIPKNSILKTKIGQSKPFVVSAIPRVVTASNAQVERGQVRGFTVRLSWTSDSGSLSDLDGARMNELIEVVQIPPALPMFATSDFFSAIPPEPDHHIFDRRDIPSTDGVFEISDQLFMFVDLRSFPPTSPVHPDVKDIFAVDNSAFVILRSTALDPDGHGHNHRTITTSQTAAPLAVSGEVSWSVVPLNLLSGAGVTVPRAGISVTQDIGSGRVEIP